MCTWCQCKCLSVFIAQCAYFDRVFILLFLVGFLVSHRLQSFSKKCNLTMQPCLSKHCIQMFIVIVLTQFQNTGKMPGTKTAIVLHFKFNCNIFLSFSNQIFNSNFELISEVFKLHTPILSHCFLVVSIDLIFEPFT